MRGDWDSLEAIEQRGEEFQDRFMSAIRKLPDRTPLSPEITGIVKKDRYIAENVRFESQPGVHVTANLCRPNKQYELPHPGVVVPCGHSSPGKSEETYQKAAALLAANGVAALVFDPVGQGERAQFITDEGEMRSATEPHNRLNTGEMLLGRNVARTHLWDGMRALDYLEARKDVNGKRLGVVGNSGGRNWTAYLAAVDDQVVASAPVG